MSTQQQNETGPSAEDICREKILTVGYDLLSGLHDLTFHHGDGNGTFGIDAYGLEYAVQDLRSVAERALQVAAGAITALEQAGAARAWLASGCARRCVNCGDDLDVVADEWRICRGQAEHDRCHGFAVRRVGDTPLDDEEFEARCYERDAMDRVCVVEDDEYAAYCEDRERAGGPFHDDDVRLTFPDGRTVEGTWYIPGPAPIGAPLVVTFEVTQTRAGEVVATFPATDVDPAGAQVRVTGLGEDFTDYGPPSLEDLARGEELRAQLTASMAQPTDLAAGQDQSDAKTGCQHPKPLCHIVCGWGYCPECRSTMQTDDGRTPKRDDAGQFIYAENGDQSQTVGREL